MEIKLVKISDIMMTSSNRNIFRVTGHLCGEFTGPRWIPYTKASDAELWCFLWSVSKYTVEKKNSEAGDLRRYRAHYDVTVMLTCTHVTCSWRNTLSKVKQGVFVLMLWWKDVGLQDVGRNKGGVIPQNGFTAKEKSPLENSVEISIILNQSQYFPPVTACDYITNPNHYAQCRWCMGSKHHFWNFSEYF